MPINNKRISKKVKERFRRSIQNVIDGLSRKILVYKQPVKAECSNCYYDKFTDSSTGKCKHTPVEAQTKQAEWEAAGNTTIRYKYFLKGRCPVCKGAGYIEIARKTWVDALITWDPTNANFSNQLTYTPAGTEGSTLVQLKTSPKYFDLFKNCARLVVDGVECKLAKPPILRGLGSQAVLIIVAFTTEKPKIDSNEIIKEYS